MSKADKMFRELGYKGNANCFQNRHGSHIYFDNQCKTIEVSGRGTGKWRDCKNKIITLAQLQAINEKVKELGWLE